MKVLKGEVISTKMEKTATVLVERAVVHPVYKKRFTRVKKYHVHDPYGVKVGQTVEFVTSKPYSKSKKWIIVRTEEEIKNKSKGKTSISKKSNKKTDVKNKKSSNSKKTNEGKEKAA